MKYQNIVMLGIQPWDIDIGCNFKNMALEISKEYRVLYINRPLDRFTSWKYKSDIKTVNRLNSIRKGIGVYSQINKNLWVFNPQVILESINWLPNGIFYKSLNRFNNLKLAKQILLAINHLKFSDYILIIDNDFYNGLYLKEFLKLELSIYYLRDYLLSQNYFNKHGKYSEPEIMKKSDIIFTNSSYLADYARQYNSNTFNIGQGCNIEEFEVRPEAFPIDISSIQYPIIGYCGALLSLRLDIELLLTLAMKRPEWNFVFVGPEDQGFKKSTLHKLTNVYFLGPKKPAEIPDYIHYFDVCLNPQVINQMTIGNYPRKIDEYLAAGKPVVATATRTMEDFVECTFLCNSVEEYINAIEYSLINRDNIDEKIARISMARSHSWQNSVNKMYTAIELFKSNI